MSTMVVDGTDRMRAVFAEIVGEKGMTPPEQLPDEIDALRRCEVAKAQFEQLSETSQGLLTRFASSDSRIFWPLLDGRWTRLVRILRGREVIRPGCGYKELAAEIEDLIVLAVDNL